MSGATDYLGLITVDEGESYDEGIFNANVTTIDKQFEKMKYSTGTYTPTFAGLVLQGTGKVLAGSYIRMGKEVTASFYFKAGTSANLGNGTITVTLPFKIANNVEQMFYGQAGIHAPGVTGTIYPLISVGNTDTNVLTLFAQSDNKNTLTPPGLMLYPFQANDVIRGSYHYITNDA